MRITFHIEVKTFITAYDEARRDAFIELFIRTARTLYAQSAMLSKGTSPTIKITSNDSERGEVELPLLEESKSPSL